ncbi:VanZ family protein [Azoarcus sp. L1K30]|uniref:VanZ family protein n=1 Tax=Azoarcus sp. L1K30 TaxID=2820277 RepID=UPI001B82F35E|nr:VanZ family protein [Azoarcus sp. L1K30]MBR0564828.1 VanZ family protein [Azoarcus sp. L1K30]
MHRSSRLYRGLFALALIGAFWLALRPAPELIQIVSWQDKIEHAVLFAGLMVLGSLGWRDRLFRLAIGLLIYGAAMEIAQSFTTYRVGDVWDWLADAIGLLAAGLALRLFASLRPPSVARNTDGGQAERRA